MTAARWNPPSIGASYSSFSRSFSVAADSTTTFNDSVVDANEAIAIMASNKPGIDSKLETLLDDLHRAAAWNHGQDGKDNDKSLWNPSFCRETVDVYDSMLKQVSEHPSSLDSQQQAQLLSADTVTLAFKALLKCHYDPDVLSEKVREWERCLGQLKQTPLTDHLSLRLLTANGKAGNVGRVLSLLQLRKARGFRPRRREFVYAITSIQAANWSQRRQRNLFVPDAQQTPLDNPTRWLDAILLNMSERKFPLTRSLANRMLLCYSAGRTGKAVHHFYRVERKPIGALPEEERPTFTQHMPQDWFHVPAQGYKYQPIKVKLDFNRAAPPYYKVPAQVKGKLLSRRGQEERQFKLDCETEPEYSVPLAAAFAFCDSLQHGACGHGPIQLNTWSYNALIKACVYRGALWRAMHTLDNMSTEANVISYNLLFAGLAAMGDVVTTQEYYHKMLNRGLQPDAFTVRSIVDGLLNLGDAAAAVTVVQDFFNQHCVLPPYTTHVKILEFCLGRDMIYEAKRHVYFIQQLWHWQPNEYHTKKFIRLMRATQRNTQLHKPALQQLFAYFGEELGDEDFL